MVGAECNRSAIGPPPARLGYPCPVPRSPIVVKVQDAPDSPGLLPEVLHMADFMLIFRGGDATSDSPEQLQKHMQRWTTWFEGLAKSGVYKGAGAPLDPGGKIVRGSKKTVSDGPFAEAKDLVGGYAIVTA